MSSCEGNTKLVFADIYIAIVNILMEETEEEEMMAAVEMVMVEMEENNLRSGYLIRKDLTINKQ
jgi:hypothetical protein